MDSKLRFRLQKIESQIFALQKAEQEFLQLEAHKKVLAAQLFLQVDGKSVAEREALVYSSQAWGEFIEGLVLAESAFNNERRKYELQLKAYDAEHLTYKIEENVVKRQS